MKINKVFISTLIAIGILIGIAFVLPDKQVNNEKIIIKCTPTGSSRIISNLQNWKMWWPGEINDDTLFSFNKVPFKIQTILVNGFYATSSINSTPVSIDVQFVSAPEKHSEFIYSSSIYFSPNPIIKCIQYVKYKRIDNFLNSFFTKLKSNFEDVKTVYGFEIIEDRVPNAYHISSKKVFEKAPTTADIYSIIDELNVYIHSKNANTVNDPIYNISKMDDTHYLLMVAVATDIPVPSNSKYLYKEMVRGKIIIGKAIGPEYEVNQCARQVEYYVKDYGRSSPAIQFNRLITDRRKEKDSTKWITTVNYPVFDKSFF